MGILDILRRLKILEGKVKCGSSSKKVYKVLLGQQDKSEPTATILENTLGGLPTYEYVNPGEYLLTLPFPFPLERTFVSICNNIDESAIHVRALKINDYTIKITSGEYTFDGQSWFYQALDNYLLYTSFSIEVYDI